MNLSFGNLRGATKTILTGVDREAANIARAKPLIRGGHDEVAVAKVKDTVNSWPSVHDRPRVAPSRASAETTGAWKRPAA